MPKLCEMAGVRGGDGFPVELWRHDETGRLTIVAYNQAGCDSVDIDLWDLINWLRSGAGSGLLLETGESGAAVGGHTSGYPEGD
jgi:hypothetical protein